MKCIAMLYRFNHPVYREVKYSDLHKQVSYLEVVKELRKPNISFSDLHSMQNTNQQSVYGRGERKG